MPEQHNHSDRGALHPGCAACDVVADLMHGAGIDPAQVRDYRRQVSPVITAPTAADLEGLDITSWRGRPIIQHNIEIKAVDDFDRILGEEMTNKAKVIESRANDAHLVWLDELLRRIDNEPSRRMPYATAALASHCFLSHGDFLLPLDLTTQQAQEVHAGLHHMGVGHSDNADHFTERVQREALRGRHRLLTQAHYSAVNKELKALQHQTREQIARASREQVITASVRALQRAVMHTRGTVAPRVSLDDAAAVTVKLGVRKPLTLAEVSWGGVHAVGTALCRPGDAFSSLIGGRLAIGRALQALGVLIEHQGHHFDTHRSQP